MDSLTQFTLGAALGEAVLGKKIGNKAILFGGLGGTIPDLDVLINPFIDAITELSSHRGESHAFFYIILFTPLIAFIVHRVFERMSKRTEENQGDRTTFMDWSWLFLLSMITHPMLDALTTYGTQLWLPFSRERVAHSSIFLVDFFYTLPMLFLMIAGAFYYKKRKKRRMLNYLGLGISTAYLCFTLVNKVFVTKHFEKALTEQNIEYNEGRLLTGPTPLNNWMWQSVAESKDGYYFGIFNWFNKDNVDFIFVPNNHHLLTKLEGTRVLDELKWFSKGYYAAIEQDDNLLFVDTRFGSVGGWRDNTPIFPFKFLLVPPSKSETGEWDLGFLRGPQAEEFDTKKVGDEFFSRLLGKE